MKQSPDLQAFLNLFSATDADSDEQTAQSFAGSASPEKQNQLLAQAAGLLKNEGSIVEILGMEANRWFGDVEEASTWLKNMISKISTAPSSDDVVVKDSNGAVLQEGDPVTVIKDLKVKGGSSDLKRGTLIKKIHLIGDPDNIECNVNGSTLVLKTCFLKKA